MTNKNAITKDQSIGISPFSALVPESSINKLINVVVGAGVIGGSVFFGRKLYKDFKRKKAEEKAFKTPEGKQAILLKQAMEGAGTDEVAIFNVGRTIKNWKPVVDIYKSLYDVSLEDDLRGDLNQKELTRFLNLVSDATNNSQGKQSGTSEIVRDDTTSMGKSIKILKGAGVVTEKATNIRSAPNLSFTSKRETAPSQKFLGILTGQETRDEDSDVIFVEVSGRMNNVFSGTKNIKFWVAKSQVGVYVNPSKAREFSEFTVSYSPFLSGLSFYADKPKLITIENCILYSPKFKAHKALRANTMVGNKVMELKDKKGNVWVKIITPQNQLRWISYNSIMEI